ncbi:uncharacterized protein LOC121899351 isoform X3 [Thunnus maccoyii]|uniref:uncharacterized protein LOC121899351 isoform X3 n=1 Tax=Thunnus maccoyii TaxID=8240 RepID=UPI001C4C395F|nr:uncharacterized protein LOC121899351 isoform X3 [Thunnus maccoyii]
MRLNDKPVTIWITAPSYSMHSGNICRGLQLLEKLHLISHLHLSLKQLQVKQHFTSYQTLQLPAVKHRPQQICLQVKEQQTQHPLLLHYSLQIPSTGTYPEMQICLWGL